MVQTKLEIKTTGIDHVVLWVSDLERSKRFYIDLLGMMVNHESDWQSFLWCGDGHQVALFHQRDGSPVKIGAELNHMALRMDIRSYEATKSAWNRKGLK